MGNKMAQQPNIDHTNCDNFQVVSNRRVYTTNNTPGEGSNLPGAERLPQDIRNALAALPTKGQAKERIMQLVDLLQSLLPAVKDLQDMLQAYAASDMNDCVGGQKLLDNASVLPSHLFDTVRCEMKILGILHGFYHHPEQMFTSPDHTKSGLQTIENYESALKEIRDYEEEETGAKLLRALLGSILK